jgi:hypothetical protein
MHPHFRYRNVLSSAWFVATAADRGGVLMVAAAAGKS